MAKEWILDPNERGAEMRAARMVGWCILRTTGPGTLPLAASLAAAGYQVWTPRRTLKRPVPGKRPDKNGRRLMMEVDAPILPTMVFGRALHAAALVIAANDPASQHPPFSVFQDAGRIGLVADREVAGFQEEERVAAELIQTLRDIDDREERRRVRANALKTEKARRKAMRAERREFEAGQHVTVDGMTALTGMTGVIRSSDGRSAMVVFGDALAIKIEAWQLSPIAVLGPQPVMATAA